jgi:hypothetical protein
MAGLVVSLVLLAPSFLLLPFPPRGGPAQPPRTPRLLTALERAGQAGCMVAPVLTGQPPALDGWLVLLAAAVAVYDALWVRFFRAGRPFAALYAPLWRVPVPMAVFPVLAWFAAAAWLGSGWVAAAASALAVGHVGNALRIAEAGLRADTAR